jgi:2-hydroxychromene-2-carboxylate isomerase
MGCRLCTRGISALVSAWARDRQRTHLSESLRDIGQDPARVLALANSENAKMALAAETNAARELGIFGSPTFAVNRESFWVDDRLEDAMKWRRSEHVQSG